MNRPNRPAVEKCRVTFHGDHFRKMNSVSTTSSPASFPGWWNGIFGLIRTGPSPSPSLLEIRISIQRDGVNSSGGKATLKTRRLRKSLPTRESRKAVLTLEFGPLVSLERSTPFARSRAPQIIKTTRHSPAVCFSRVWISIGPRLKRSREKQRSRARSS